ncbi:potassium-transporting ATPase subunit A [Advenella kashmirensis WT001]|uniref:Potassium-transporting ATPase subunit A n=1 Tax=Advenella kashmirensis (strain DSM 17095 / LMG 22695 / WT001) TaxID=1036672 RepID=I3UFD7_ADVKW|nr:potassium-transporting ATPase subunit KdpA [Advenella kashmirensis]AFK63725.1 potassium-transporting ATPase subunit A [Advenella kashmirensis WT001]
MGSSGLYGMLIFVILAVFIAGLMIGRTPEYLGKKIEMQEMKMIALALLVPPFLILGGTGLSVVLDVGVASLGNPGAHGLSEVLYAFTSAANNNGSAFAGLSANNVFYNLMLALAMFAGRFAVIGAVLAVAGYLAAKQRVPVNVGTMPTHGVLFGVLLIGVVLIMGALTYIPSLALGPIAEHMQLFSVQSAE